MGFEYFYGFVGGDTSQWPMSSSVASSRRFRSTQIERSVLWFGGLVRSIRLQCQFLFAQMTVHGDLRERSGGLALLADLGVLGTDPTI